MCDWMHSAASSGLAEYFYEMAVRRDDGRRVPIETNAIDILDSHFRCLDVPVPCSRAKPFLPGLAMPSTDLRIPTPITVHVDHCPQCAADLRTLRELGLTGEQAQSLQRLYERTRSRRGRLWRRCVEENNAMPQVVFDIAERPDSGVATVYSTIDEGQGVAAAPGDPYSDYPIRVVIIRRKPQSVLSRSRGVLRGAALRPLARRILKPAMAVAAVFVLVALFHYTQSTSGVALADVVRAFGQAKNVRIVGFDPVSEEAIYELWVARDLNLVGQITDRECIVYDLAIGEKEDIGAGKVYSLDNASLANVRTFMERCLGFSFADIPSDAAWCRTGLNGNLYVYEITWMRKTYAGRDMPVKYEVVVDVTTKLPVCLRMFYWDSFEMDWMSGTVVVLKYLADVDVESF